MAARVFVVNYAGHDFSGAKPYGELVSITTGYVSHQSLDRVKFDVIREVIKSEPEDYLCLSGTLVINVIAALAWFTKHHIVKLLVYDFKQRKYRELVLTADNLDELCREMLPEG